MGNRPDTTQNEWFKQEDNEFNRQTINFKDLNFEKFKKLEFDNSNFFSDQSKLFNVKNIMDTIDKSNMVFLHIYNPHLHPDNKNQDTPPNQILQRKQDV